MIDQSENARRVLVRILKSPRDFDMAHWYLKSPCGTTACIAGHAGLEMGWIPTSPNPDFFRHPQEERAREISDLGREFLNLDAETARLLFRDTNRVHALTILHRAAQGETITEDLVLSVLDDLRVRSYVILVSKLQDEYLTEEERATMVKVRAGYLSQPA